MPASNGMAFVVILHLSPKHESRPTRYWRTGDAHAGDPGLREVKIEADHVYVIAPSKQLSMERRRLLEVTDMERPRGQHMAIDTFFRTWPKPSSNARSR
jgi:two-component system CheB/CheR fusion protein